MPDGNPVFPQEGDFHLFGDVKSPAMEEPTPFMYDFELINIHTGFAGDKLMMNIKKGYESYKHFANEPIIALGPNGIDAIGCGEK